jgi:hypothetical protein
MATGAIIPEKINTIESCNARKASARLAQKASNAIHNPQRKRNALANNIAIQNNKNSEVLKVNSGLSKTMSRMVAWYLRLYSRMKLRSRF